MNDKRKATEDFIISNIDHILPGSQNKQFYKDLFASMDDAQFDQWMQDLRDKKMHLCLIAPNGGKQTISIERNLAHGKKLGYNFFQRVWIGGTGDRPTYLTPVPYMILLLPLRRQGQLLVKKISIPQDNRSVDDLTGQPTGASKGSKISAPEGQVMAANQLDECLNEFWKFRGGDTRGFDAMNKTLSKTGTVSLKQIQQYASGVESTKTLKTILSGMHLKSTL